VRADVWSVGLGDYVARVYDIHLDATVRLCRTYPGTIDSLLAFVAATASDVGAVAALKTAAGPAGRLAAVDEIARSVEGP
jgi:hypothetical protein